jgi:gamma-glutamyltranspeptidase/glutathione hydrolase
MEASMGHQAAVSASSSSAAEAGISILRQGGNAVDAAVATALASCIADCCNTGIGGYGGHMLVAPPGEAAVSIDFNMWVPAAHADRRPVGGGPRASVVPNVVAGLDRALAAMGTMSWAEVTAPAIALCADGVEANRTLQAAFAQVAGADFLAECFEIEPSASGEKASGFRFRQPALARTLEQMAARGPAWFYNGPIGSRAVAAMRAAGSDVTEAEWREAPQAVTIAQAPSMRIGEAVVYSTPLGTTGSLCMFGTLAAGAALAREQTLDSPEGITAWVSQIASMWSYRFGAPDGNRVSVDGLEGWIERAFASNMRAAIPKSTGHTCHLNTLDGDGMMAAVTLTHGPAWFGTRWAVPESSVVVNAGAHLLAGVAPVLVGLRAYAVTNMAPTIVRPGDGAALAVGCPGARRIPTILGVVLARHLFGGDDLQAAVSRGRFHAESRDLATVEAGRADASVVAALRKRFATVEEEGVEQYFGPFTGIRREAGGAISLGLDDRLSGYAVLCPKICASLAAP